MSHNAAVQELWDDFARGRNSRVPFTFACDEQVWLKVTHETFGRFYSDPRTHLDVQLRGKLWWAENCVGDQAAGLPERWQIVPQWWMEENELAGCEAPIQADDYAWSRPLDAPLVDIPRILRDVDAEQGIRRGRAWALYAGLCDLAKGMTFRDRPVEIVPPGGTTHGVFTKAVEVCGAERLCLALVEEPRLAGEVLDEMTDLTIRRIRAWRRLTRPDSPEYPRAAGLHRCDDSPQLICAADYERHILPRHERLLSAMSTGPRSIHLCGRASQHYRPLHRRLGIGVIDGPGPFVDHAAYLAELGPSFRFTAQTDHVLLARGSPAEIEGMVRGMLTPGARVPGRFSVMGFITRDTLLENLRVCYDAALRWGRID